MSEATRTKSRLGRGLSSLIPSSAPPAEGDAGSPAIAPPGDRPRALDESLTVAGDTTVAALSLDLIVPNPHQPRRQFDEPGLAELVASLKMNGVIQPIVVRSVGSTYELIAGERRFRAAQRAGFQTIPAIIRQVDALTQAQMALVENIQREDLNPLDRARGYRALLDQLGLTQAELASRLGEDRSSIANFLRLLDLSGPVQAHVQAGRLSTGHAKLLAGVTGAAEQERLANVVVAQELSVRNLERLLQGKAVAPAEAKGAAPSAHIADLEKNVARQLGMRVQIRGAKKGRGRLVIHYASLDQFDDLLSRLGVQAD